MVRTISFDLSWVETSADVELSFADGISPVTGELCGTVLELQPVISVIAAISNTALFFILFPPCFPAF